MKGKNHALSGFHEYRPENIRKASQICFLHVSLRPAALISTTRGAAGLQVEAAFSAFFGGRPSDESLKIE